MIKINELRKTYNSDFELYIPQLTIHDGEFIQLLGNNGAGKTTLLRLLIDLIKADEGSVDIFGSHVDLDEKWKKHTAAFYDEGFLIPFLKPSEYFDMVAEQRNISSESLWERLREYHFFLPEDIQKSRKYIRELSAGNRQKVGIVTALVTGAPLLLLDEPFAHLDPGSQEALNAIMKDISRNPQLTAVVSSHNLEYLQRIPGRMILMHQGLIHMDLAGKEANIERVKTYFSGSSDDGKEQ